MARPRARRRRRCAPPRRPSVPGLPCQFSKSVFTDYIVCLEDGKKLKMLKRHLQTAYHMSPEQYRAKWGPRSELSDGRARIRKDAIVARQGDWPWHAPERSQTQLTCDRPRRRTWKAVSFAIPSWPCKSAVTRAVNLPSTATRIPRIDYFATLHGWTGIHDFGYRFVLDVPSRRN